MTTVAMTLFVAYLTLGERVHPGRVPGFPGVPVLEIAFVAAAFLAWIQAGSPRPTIRGGWVVSVGPLFVLLLVLPLLGVLLGTYGMTSLYFWIVVLVPLAVLALTAAAGARLLPFVHAAILVQGGYGLGQTLFRVGIVPDALWTPLQEWDAATQRSLSEAYVIYGRSTGLFINANAFALWSAVALVLSYFYLSGWRRWSGVAVAVLGIVGSQSRTGLACLTVLLLLWGAQALRDSTQASRHVLRAAVLGLPLLVVAWAMGLFQMVLASTLVARLTTALSVVTEGVDADENLLGRVEAWQLALSYSPLDPRFSLGTLGPPQVQFISFIDNQFVAYYLQGGVLLVGTYVLALLSPLLLHRRGARNVVPLIVISAVVTLASLTLTPMYTPQAMSLVWVVAMLSLLGLDRGDQALVGGPEAVDAVAPRPGPQSLDTGR